MMYFLLNSANKRPWGLPAGLKHDDWCVHAAGCRDLTKERKAGADVDFRAADLDGLMAWFADAYGVEAGYESPWEWGAHVHVHPCAKGA